jgi:hypothetical protein
MPEIEPARLLIDIENPRIPNQPKSQREAIRAIAADQKDKLLVLAKSILADGLNPTELPVVMPSDSDQGRFITLEGNRRLTAIRAMEAPNLIVDAVPADVFQGFQKLSEKYEQQPVATIECVLVADRADAQRWIELRHTGPNAGAGLVGWGSDEKARFRARNGGGIELHTRLLNFLEDGQHLSNEDRQRVPVTNFKRLIETPAVRQRVGLSMAKGGALQFVDEEAGIRGLLYIINDLSAKTTKVSDIYTSDQRAAYADKLPASVLPSAKQRKAAAAGQPASRRASGATPTAKRVNISRMRRRRDRLIPSECFLRVLDGRIKRIELELRTLDLKDYPNAISVLFRVFLELTIDYYLIDVLKAPQNSIWAKLGHKMNQVVQDLENKGVLTKQEANPIKAASGKNSFLLPSITMMHEYVHNRHQIPGPDDLRAEWDGLQRFFTAVWPL